MNLRGLLKMKMYDVGGGGMKHMEFDVSAQCLLDVKLLFVKLVHL